MARETESSIELAEAATVAEAAAILLPVYAASLFKAGRKAFAGEDLDAVHRFRIAAKRFRYAVELFAPVYGPGLRTRIAALKKLQEVLGDLNDAVATRELFKGRAEAEEADKFLKEREKALWTKARTYWDESLAGPEIEASWKEYFARFIRKPVASVVS
jgi:CHAD domain-containing protein